MQTEFMQIPIWSILPPQTGLETAQLINHLAMNVI